MIAGMVQQQIDVTYHGVPALAGVFAGMLEREGLMVRWRSPSERHGAAAEVDTVVAMAVSGLTKDIVVAGVKRGIEKFHQRFPRGGEIDIEDDSSAE